MGSVNFSSHVVLYEMIAYATICIFVLFSSILFLLGVTLIYVQNAH